MVDDSDLGSELTVTMLHSDIEGSTRLLQDLGPRFGEMLLRHREILRGVFTRHGGSEHGTEGDSFMVSFATGDDATSAALEAQLALLDEPWPTGAALRVRMGVHTGPAHLLSETLIGLALHHAARIGAAAHGGQILASAHLVRGSAVPRDAQWRSLGSFDLRDAPRMGLYELAHPGLPKCGPPRATRSGRTNLREPATPFVGRRAEAGELHTLLRSARLVSVVGPGGSGKTRLACRVAAELSAEHPGGVWFVDLSNLRGDEVDVDDLVIDAMGAATAESSDAASVIGAEPTLLVLDGAEHLLDAVGSFLEALLDRCAACALVSSRAELALPDEHVWRIPPMIESDVLELLVGHRRRLGHHVERSDDLVDLCRQADGLPLAAEILAANDSLVIERGDEAEPVASDRGRTIARRRQSLGDTIRSSERLVSSEARSLLRSLSMLTGPWTADDVDAIEVWRGIEPPTTRRALAELVEHSLVVPEPSEGQACYRLLGPIREYVRAQLDAADREIGVASLIMWARAEAETDGSSVWHCVAGPEVRTRLRRRRMNLLAAVDHALARDDAESAVHVCGALGYWLAMYEPRTAGPRFSACLDLDSASGAPWYPPLLASAALLGQNHQDATMPSIGETIERMDSGQEHDTLPWLPIGIRAYAQLEATTSTETRHKTLAEAHDAALESRQPLAVAMTSQALAIWHLEFGRAREAVAVLDECLHRWIGASEPSVRTRLGQTRAGALRRLHDLHGAAEELEAVLVVARDVGDVLMEIDGLIGLARVAHLRGEDMRSSAIVDEAVEAATGRLTVTSVADVRAVAASHAHLAGLDDHAIRHLGETLRLVAREPDGPVRNLAMASALCTRASVRRSGDEHVRARADLSEALDLLNSIPENDTTRKVTQLHDVSSDVMDGLALLAIEAGDPDDACRLAGAIPSRRSMVELGPSRRHRRVELMTALDRQVGDRRDSLIAEGRELDLSDLVQSVRRSQ